MPDMKLAGAKMAMMVCDPRLGTCLALVGHVDGGSRILADEDRGETRSLPGLLAQLGDLARDIRPHPGRHRSSVDDRRSHRPGR